MRFSALGALVIALSAASSAAAQLTTAEQAMIRTVDAEQTRTVSMLTRWVEQNSGTLNLPGVAAVGKMVGSELQPLGMELQWIDMKAAHRSGHLVARHKGNGLGKRLLLIGHLDTVFEADSPFQHWRREGDWAHGPGAADDKGGDAVIVAALRAMQQAGTLRNADITVFLTGDEEDAGQPIEVARRDLIAAGKRADVALDFEGLIRDAGKDMGSTSRRSAGSWTIEVRAKSAHSSGVFTADSGYGAIYELSRILDTFRRELREDKLTYSVGLSGGGTTADLDEGHIRLEATGKTNIIPPVAVARGDLRAIDRAQIERTEARMRAIVAQSLPGTQATIVFDSDGYPPMPPTPGNRAILDALNHVNRDAGFQIMAELDPVKRGAGDISFVAADVDGLAGLGTASEGDHTPAERVNIPSIALQAKRAAILMSRLAATPR
jgi:glutamate carboxypeptidase